MLNSVLLSLAVALLGCGGGEDDPQPAAASLTISPETVNVPAEGGTYLVNVTTTGQEWGVAENLGFPYSSPYDDLLFCNMALWIGKPQDFESPYYHLKALNPHSCEIIRYFMGDVEAVQCFAMKAPGRTIWSTAASQLHRTASICSDMPLSIDMTCLGA